jgi:hypothetical protein
MTSVDRVEQLLNMEVRMSERDNAGIIIASRVDSATRRKTLEDVIRHLKAYELEDKQDDV